MSCNNCGNCNCQPVDTDKPQYLLGDFPSYAKLDEEQLFLFLREYMTGAAALGIIYLAKLHPRKYIIDFDPNAGLGLYEIANCDMNRNSLRADRALAFHDFNPVGLVLIPFGGALPGDLYTHLSVSRIESREWMRYNGPSAYVPGGRQLNRVLYTRDIIGTNGEKNRHVMSRVGVPYDPEDQSGNSVLSSIIYNELRDINQLNKLSRLITGLRVDFEFSDADALALAKNPDLVQILQNLELELLVEPIDPPIVPVSICKPLVEGCNSAC